MTIIPTERIRLEYRGDQTAVIAFSEGEELYDVIQNPSQEQTKRFLAERTYQGISSETIETIMQEKERLNKGLTTLNNLDKRLTIN